MDSCCGFILLGPLGLLCGACDSGVTTHEFWICHDCGNQFSPGQGERFLQKEKDAAIEYDKNKQTLSSASDKSFAELENDANVTDALLEEKRQAYKDFIARKLTAPDKETVKHAKALKREESGIILLVVLAIIVLSISLLAAISEGNIVVAILSLLADIACFAYNDKFIVTGKKDAENFFSQEENSEYTRLIEELSAAKEAKEKANELFEAAKKIADYEAKHSEKK